MSRQRDPEDLSAFGRMVEKWRSAAGYSQATVAKLIGAHQRTLSDWLEEGGMPGAVHQIARLSTLMGTSLEKLLEEDAGLAPLRDPEFVARLLRRLADPRVLECYAEERRGKTR
jgi:transcriptional regulator with XRE-family HTH domain